MTDVPPGSTLHGRYEVREVLGRGAFGETLLARERETGDRVAIKTLHPSKASDLKAFELFEREATVLRGLRHQGVPAIRASFRAEWDGAETAFLVMEYIEGPTLEQLIAERHTFSPEEVMSLTLELAGILEYLHDRVPPILHRDIKPANVILRGGKTPVLVDFGAVRNVFRAADESGSTVVGTYGYMPYEQYMGQATPASDLYALGATLLHLLTGRPPSDFLSDQSRLEVPENLPGGEHLRNVLTRLLAPSAADRFPSAAELKHALLHVPATAGSHAVAVTQGASVPTVARAQTQLAELPEAPRALSGITREQLARVAPSTWQLLETLATPGSKTGSLTWIVFLSIVSIGIMPLMFALSARSRRQHLEEFFRRGRPAVGRIQAITVTNSQFGDRGAQVTYEFEADGQVHRGGDHLRPAVADRWREGDAIAVLYLPDEDYESVVISAA